ncbi:MAG TPA: hypothetical protein VFV28_03310 [Limnobacter sp.]|nr:hypothetical protein [Limnobacter sp.]
MWKGMFFHRQAVAAIFLLFLHSSAAFSQQTIANPLVRPAQLMGARSASQADAAATSRPGEQTGAAPADQAELRRQAERRITQEDFNLRQQALNSPVVPQPLVNLFSNMQVTAYFQGAIVMRRVDSDLLVPQVVSAPASTSASGRVDQPAAAPVAGRPISRSTAALRLRVGRIENISGYMLRARVEGQDISVEWRSDSGAWVNVFAGVLESSAGGLPQVPSESQLLKVETELFDYLVPELKTRTFSPSGTLGGQQPPGNFGSGFGFNSPGFNNQPGFGTGFPN